MARLLLGDPPRIRDVGLLDSAAARPQTTVGGIDAYDTIRTKAAALLQSVVKNHALIDGNKRLGWLAAAVFIELNDSSAAAASNDDVYQLVTRIAAGSPTVDGVAEALQSFSSYVRHESKTCRHVIGSEENFDAGGLFAGCGFGLVVGAEVAGALVEAVAAFEGVVAVAAEQRVILAVAFQMVWAGLAPDQVIAGPTKIASAPF